MVKVKNVELISKAVMNMDRVLHQFLYVMDNSKVELFVWRIHCEQLFKVLRPKRYLHKSV